MYNVSKHKLSRGALPSPTPISPGALGELARRLVSHDMT